MKVDDKEIPKSDCLLGSVTSKDGEMEAQLLVRMESSEMMCPIVKLGGLSWSA